LRIFIFSASVPFDWWPNWLQKNPSMASLSPYLAARVFMELKSLTVVSHMDATFTTRTVFPLYLDRFTFSPLTFLALKS